MSSRNIYRRSVAPHNQRVAADIGIGTGAVSDKTPIAIALMNYYEQQKDNIKLFYFPALTGNKFRVSGANTFVSKGYSNDNLVTHNDLTQTSDSSQPYLSGNIAPNELPCIKNPNGGNRFLIHPTISFGAGDSWSVTTVLNMNGILNQWYAGSLTNTILGLYWDAPKVSFRNENGTLYSNNSINTSKFYGKNTVVTYVATGGGTLKIYINGIFLFDIVAVTTASFGRLFYMGDVNNQLKGVVSAHIIKSFAPTAQQVTEEHALLRSFIPEIESVQIGTQTWATSNCEMAATPQGNVIREIQANGNIEKITNAANREFSIDNDPYWTKDAGVTISGGVCHFVNVAGGGGAGIRRAGISTVGKFYKVQFTVSNYVSGNVLVYTDGNLSIIINRNGTYTGYTNSINGSMLYISNWYAAPATFDIDNISVQEIGWSGSQELYDGIYAQTSGTVEQKTYAAVKAAAMWRNCQNSTDSGAIYGKEYNKFAALLLKMDIDYYNVANPTTLWGYRVPLRADLTTLAANGGNALKLAGNTYWNTANGTNSTGFSALGSGIVNADGTNSALKVNTYLLCSDADFAREIKDGDNTCNEVAITIQGGIIRLIKV